MLASGSSTELESEIPRLGNPDSDKKHHALGLRRSIPVRYRADELRRLAPAIIIPCLEWQRDGPELHVRNERALTC